MDMTKAMDQMARQGLPAVHIVTTALLGKTASHLREDHDVTPFDLGAVTEDKLLAKKANAALHIKAHRKEDS